MRLKRSFGIRFAGVGVFFVSVEFQATSLWDLRDARTRHHNRIEIRPYISYAPLGLRNVNTYRNNRVQTRPYISYAPLGLRNVNAHRHNRVQTRPYCGYVPLGLT